MDTPNLNGALPAARPALLDLASPITDELIELFAAAKQGHHASVVSTSPTLPANARGSAAGVPPVALAAPGEKVALSEQGKDYRQKVRTFAAELARYTAEPFRVVDLAGERVNWVLERRLHPRTGRPVRESTRNAYRRVLGSLLGWLYETGRLAGRVHLGGRDFSEPEKPLVTFTPEQVKVIFTHLAIHDSVMSRRLTALVAVALDDGARRGDALSLRLSGVDATRRILTIVGKGNKTRRVPVGPFAWQAIERYLEVRPAAPTDAVFLQEDGRTPARGKEIGQQFRRVLVKLGLVTVPAAHAPAAERVGEDRDVQALRRTFASAFARSGRSDDELSAMMGWSANYAHQVRPRYTAITVEDLVPGHAASSPLEAFLKAA